LVEAERLQVRVTNDVFKMREIGFCQGGENYSRHLEGRAPGEAPYTLLDYLGMNQSGQSDRDWLLIVDESHVTVPQLSAMYKADRARKQKLIYHGFRLPSALDNRPLKFDEFWERIQQTVFVSATPGKIEREWVEGTPVEMVIRPTYVCDPRIEVRPLKGHLEDVLQEIIKRTIHDQQEGTTKFTKSRTLVTTLTKRDAEDMASYLQENDVKCTFIHSGLTTHERAAALKALQSGEIDCLVGVNLLREGLDLPQVSLVAILNADSEGFLRCETSLLQTVGRAARNVDGTAILYADRITDSMQKCIEATSTRRKKQIQYNEDFGLTMTSTIGSSVQSIFDLSKDQIDAEFQVDVSRQYGDTIVQLYGIDPSSDSIKTNFLPTNGSSREFVTDHIPNDPGVYFWKDDTGKILYIGKAVKLRSRIKSYLSPKAVLGSRIKAMIAKAVTIEFTITESERDALILESNLIKFHQPPFNVLLKDDSHYPYICASIGDTIPRLFYVPQKHTTTLSNQNYRYYGPYTSKKELNEILSGVEAKYGLQGQAFLARHGSTTKESYNQIFDQVIEEVFNSNDPKAVETLINLRSQYEEAGLLFDSKYNRCRDIVAIGRSEDGNGDGSLIIHLIQLRNGIVAGSYSYECIVPFGASTDEDSLDAIQTVLCKRHYPSVPTHNNRLAWFPEDILVPIELSDDKDFKAALRQSFISAEGRQMKACKISSIHRTGKKRESDVRALEFATKNANQVAYERLIANKMEHVPELHDGTAAKDLAKLLSLKDVPVRIECFVSQ
jgi:Helicase conserved C-terminal domain/Ultra-violet resistance protein B/GIY-YIG catalytic domain